MCTGLFGSDSIIRSVAERLLSVLDCSFAVNWCQHWFEYFPNPPLNVLSLAENVLAHHDKELLQHFVACGVTSQVKDVDTSVYMT